MTRENPQAAQGSQFEVSVILTELSRNDQILQSYRDQFLVAETFTAAVAASTLLQSSTISVLVALLGVPLLVGWIVVVRWQASAFDYWYAKLAELEDFQEYLQHIRKRGYLPRLWLGGGRGKMAVGILQWVFMIFWLMVLGAALLVWR